MVFMAHLVAAFQFYHHWSHTHAFDDTAEQTRQMIGIAFGHGIYLSYAFAAVWCCDVAWWWLGKSSYDSRPGWLTLLIHGYLLFIALNGAIVFEGGVTRWGGLAASAMLAIVAMRHFSKKNKMQPAAGKTVPMPATEVDEQPVS